MTVFTGWRLRAARRKAGQLDNDQAVSRRGMLKGAAGAGLVAASAGGVVAASSGTAAAGTPLLAGAGGQQIVAHVRDVRSGEIEVFVGSRQVTIHDREVAVRLANAAR